MYIHCIHIPEIVPRKNSPKDWKSVRSKKKIVWSKNKIVPRKNSPKDWKSVRSKM